MELTPNKTPLASDKDGLEDDLGVAAARRILVVEDDVDTRSALRIQLEAAGYEVILLGEGQNALAMVQKVRPHAIILDLGLPGIDGFEVLQRIRVAHPEISSRIIVLSAWDESQNKARALEGGARFFFQKPIPILELRHGLETIFANDARTD